ncbi:MAG: VTC domain-containing protein [Bacteroidetes bacterium]|nr:VTC domain-containing protein [Bacteroidota bacterium]
MSQTKEQSEPFRYERKFSITDYSYSDVKQILKFHPACFSEIFQERSVNNIYFDTLGLNDYYDNINGEQIRSKVRIRWYGDLFGTIQTPVLEYKIKTGLLGKKRSYKLQPFLINNNFSKSQIINAIGTLPQNIKDQILSLKPTLLNSYKRNYFLSADKNFRVTLDHRLTFYKILYSGNTFTNKSIDHNSTVLELKYDSSLETEAKLIAGAFPLKLTKSSKYLQGLERVFI